MTTSASGSTPVDRFFAVPMVLLALTAPVFFLGQDTGRTAGWLLYGTGLLLTLCGFFYCALARKSPSWGGASCAAGAVIIGVLALNGFGWPW